VPETIPHDHPEFARLRRFAARMVEEALELADGSSLEDQPFSEPGESRRIQAFTYAVTALVNEAKLATTEELALALGCVIGSLAANVPADDLRPFLETILGQSSETLSAARGEAPQGHA
jgi:hypothetical protein